jgi:gliding motility-associated-like protein
MRKILFLFISFYFISSAVSQTIDFTFETGNGLFCSPSAVTFKQTCTGNPVSFLWNFGNNQFGDQPVQSASYAAPGTYTVKLVAIFANTTLELTKTVVINPAVTASIAFDKNYICQPGTINFTGSGSGNINNYQWDFGDGTPVVNTAAAATSHAFTNYATRNVTLKTSSAAGCTDTTSTVISIQKIPITGTVSQFRGCVPATVNFKSTVTLPVNSTVTSYTWDYGDGTPPDVTASDAATHNYPLPGNYFPKLTIATSDGCTNTFNFERLYFGTPPANHTAYAVKDTICASDSAVFIAHATNADKYVWVFGDGSPNITTTDTIIKHKYRKLGSKRVYSLAYYNNCGTTVSQTFLIDIIGVVADFSFANTCANKNIYAFSDSSLGVATSRLWDFGDATQLPNVVNPVHTFPPSGKFKTTLILYDNVSGCNDTVAKFVYTAVPSLLASANPVCINKKVSFSIQNNYLDTSARYTWNISGKQTDTSASVLNVTADSLGSYNNFVVINYGKQNCPDTVGLNAPFVVRGPQLDFTVAAVTCLSNPLQVTNNSKPFIAGDLINSWSWDFGDSKSVSAAPQPVPFQYTSPGTYVIRLIATDINGCEDTLTKSVLVNPSPFVKIFPATATLCFGESLTMIAYHSDNLVWSPAGNISCTTCDTTIANPPVSTKYFGTATNLYNCSVQDSNYVKVPGAPFTTSVTPADVSICKSEAAVVDVNPKGKKIVWTPAAGLSDAAVYNPVISPAQTTSYTVTLTDSAGCATAGSSAVVNVYVKPQPSVDAGPDQFYPKGTPYNLSPVYSSNVVAYLWTPAVLLTCSDCPNPSGNTEYTQQYLIKVTSDSGCIATDSILVAVECKSANIFMPKAFSPNNDNLNDFFYPTTLGIKSISRFTIYNRQGRILFETSNFKPNDKFYGWNGKFKGTYQSVDTYVYSLEAICETGEKLYKKGSFILLK